MSLPSNKLKKIATGGTTYDIVPEMLQNNGHAAELPTLSADVTLATTDYVQANPSSTTATLTGIKIGDTSYAVSGGGVAELMEEITWSNLKTKRDNSQLEPGKFYRITDYTCTTVQTNTSAASNLFDIIVRADSTSKLNEDAWAEHHTGDAYFASCNLSAWKLKYCLDNDTTRFAWADSTNGKGVIYYMKDEWGNECPYDFKNIKFSKSGVYTSTYTFSTAKNYGNDASIDITKKCYKNIIKEYVVNNIRQLNFIVFYTTSSSYVTAAYNNYFDRNCHDIYGDNNCIDNTIGENCSMIVFSSWCNKIKCGIQCNNLEFSGSNNYRISIGDVCSYCTFMYGCQDIFLLGNNIDITMNRSYNIVIGHNCQYIKFGDDSTTIQYVQNVIIDEGCKYLYINSSDTSSSSSNMLQNVHICLGVVGSSSSNKRTITVPDRALAYETTYKMSGSTEVML